MRVRERERGLGGVWAANLLRICCHFKRENVKLIESIVNGYLFTAQRQIYDRAIFNYRPIFWHVTTRFCPGERL